MSSTGSPAGPGAGADARVEPVRRPGIGLFLTEPGRGAVRLGAFSVLRPWLRKAPRGEPHGVLVLPGLMTTDTSTAVLRRFVRGLGYTTWGWRLGRNIGPTAEIVAGMPRAVDLLVQRTGGPVSVIGWSLGGVYARELARRRPELIRQVITLGSPFALRDPLQTRAGNAYQRNATRHVREGAPSFDADRPIPVPSTSVYSRRDGIVHWQTCIEPESNLNRNVEVRCAHLAFGHDPATLWLVADRLAQPRPGEQRFEPPRSLRLLYP